MDISKIILLERKDLSKDRIYYKVKIIWNNKPEEIVELWGIVNNILVTKEYRSDIEQIIYAFNHDKYWGSKPLKSNDKCFYPLRYFIKEAPVKYENEIREWMVTGISNYIKEIPGKCKGYLFYDKISNVAIPLCAIDWFTDDYNEFKKKIVDAWGEIVLTTTYALVAKWVIKRQIHYLWKVKDYSKRYLLLEDCGLIDEQLENVQKSLIFTCPVCHDETTPAGLAKLPKPFYNLNKEILATKFDSSFKIKISDPNSELINYEQVKRIMQSISDFEHPATISYNQYKKIANNQELIDKTSDYIDYVTMIKQMGGEFVLPWEITSAQQLERLHVNAITEYNLRRDQSSEEMKFKYLKLKESYPKVEIKNKNFIIKYPDDLDDLNLEGTYLHHCVRSYKGRILNSEAIIVFLRTINEPDVPFVTMQLKRMPSGDYDLVQAHGKYNCSIKTIDGVYDFVKDWCSAYHITMENIDRAL